VTPEFKT